MPLPGHDEAPDALLPAAVPPHPFPRFCPFFNNTGCTTLITTLLRAFSFSFSLSQLATTLFSIAQLAWLLTLFCKQEPIFVIGVI
jgi:hypothetical protein